MSRKNPASAPPIHPKSPFQVVAFVCLVALLSYSAARLGGTLVIRPEMIWAVWPGCAFLVAVLLLTPRKIWPVLLIAGLSGFALYDAQEHLPIRASGFLLVADSIEVLVATFGVRYVFGGVPRLNSVKSLAKYSLFAVILAPVSVASAAALALEGDSWWVGFFTEALALLTLTPAILGWVDIAVTRAKGRKAHYLEAAVVFVGLTIFAYFSFMGSGSESRPALLYSLIPFMLWAALRFGIVGTSTSMVLVSYVAVVGTVNKRGPFTGGTPPHDVLFLQLFLLVAATSFMVFAVVVEDQRASEQAVRASEQRLRLAQQAARIGTFERDVATGVVTWASELELMYGLSPGDFAGTTSDFFENLIHPDDRKHVMYLSDQALKTGEPMTAEWRIVWPDGSVHWIGGHWQSLMDESGQPSMVVGINMDITERKLSEERLREYEQAVEGAEDMIGVIDREYRFLLANRQYLKMRNMTREQLVGHLIPEALDKEVFETVVKPKLDECFKGDVVRYEFKFSYPNVGERELSLSYFPIEGPNGIDRVVCILHDITDRKRNEESLRVSEQRFRLAAQAGKMYSFEWDVITDEVVRSSEHANVLGIAEPLRATHQEFVKKLHPDDRPRFTTTIAGLTPANPTAEIIYRVPSSDGGLVWLRSRGRGFFDSDGKLLRVIGMVADITDLKRAEEALSGLSQKLIKAQEQERARIARELHDDIAQRLALLALELQKLQQSLPHSASEHRTFVDALYKRATEISADVQSMSHELHSSKLEYLGIVAAMKSFCRELSDRQKVEIDFKSDGVSTRLSPDISLCLFRVLQEALHNSVKHSGVRHFDVQLREDSREIRLDVNDSGQGFEIETAIQSHGLGLISMQERVRLVNGTIAIESKPMQGTAIRVRVPVRSEETGQRAAG